MAQSFFFLSGLVGIRQFLDIDPIYEIIGNLIGVFLPWSIPIIFIHLIFKDFINTKKILAWNIILFPFVFGINIYSLYSWFSVVGMIFLTPFGILLLRAKSKKKSKINPQNGSSNIETDSNLQQIHTINDSDTNQLSDCTKNKNEVNIV